MVVQGFGSVGRHAARFLVERGAVLVGAADSAGALADPEGIDVAALIALKEAGGSVLDHPRGRRLDREAMIDVPCDIWIPAARPDVIDQGNVDRLRAKVVLEGANIPAEAEQALHARGVVVVPDFIANAGGVISAAVEYRGGTPGVAFESIAEKIGANTREVLEAATRARIPRAKPPSPWPGDGSRRRCATAARPDLRAGANAQGDRAPFATVASRWLRSEPGLGCDIQARSLS